MELTIGLELSNTPLDFEDGELKTNKCDRSGKPLETMFITQIASIIDELLAKRQFQETKLYKKFQRLLYVPISKDGNPEDWMYLPPIQIDLSLPKYQFLAQQLESDYYDICDQLNQQLSESNRSTFAYCKVVNSFKFVQRIPSHIILYFPIFTNAKYQIKTVHFILRKNL